MSLPAAMDSHHGVMIHYRDKGIFIFGEAGAGKSSLALELIHHGATLIADDVVDFSLKNEHLIAHCPKLLSGLLHTRELGLMDIRKVCGEASWHASTIADLCIELKRVHHPKASVNTPTQHKVILGKALVVLTLSVENPASFKTRIDSWLTMQASHKGNHEKMQLWQLDKMAF
ncbi:MULTISPECIES: HPr kinase/phosphatase C-terminal domain-containing protein [unclassified Methylophaga]|jgi:HPr kinase/phosphorylase|uniref:HPr kinase/phosphorylase n=1 Tax=unclassified Methylophaga TaxID=2629249 RepID=UPI000C8CCA9A|nr:MULTISPECIES: HPr kinase/phosphatase C-terminal domain-containing protein [unclassified Methylophaga]MAL49354.1 hypothetical protein [Methylophaga sp.]HCC82764.1 hypothetical protein [Methylophaga sp.]|tara:strand:- start:16093 stop:16611 length:519 start_codon:yes stop_codon:yes gene_type:complete